ncbi:MAG: hypothetical protein L3J28_08430 [Candidatus Polarisedimenticolaceae bacterium]|nr:hypothetical protein [Candidatus Polarisedimenticolaceae bacterium]
MGIDSASINAVRGIQQGFHNMRRIAADIATVDVQHPEESAAPADLARSLVELKQAALQTQASVKVAQTADLMIGSLLDIKA